MFDFYAKLQSANEPKAEWKWSRSGLRICSFGRSCKPKSDEHLKGPFRRKS